MNKRDAKSVAQLKKAISKMSPRHLKLMSKHKGYGWIDDSGWSLGYVGLVDEWASIKLPCRIVDRAGTIYAEHNGGAQ